MAGYASLRSKKDELLRKALDGGVHIGESTAAVLDHTIFTHGTGVLGALPTGYHDLGYLTTKGAVCTRKVTTSEIDSWGSSEPTRSDITQDQVTIDFEPQETNAVVLALFNSQALATLDASQYTNGSIVVAKPLLPPVKFYRVAVFGVDEDDDGETVIIRFFPRAKITAYGAQTFANGADPITYAVTLTAYLDSTAGYSELTLFGGDGWKAKLTDMGFTVGSSSS